MKQAILLTLIAIVTAPLAMGIAPAPIDAAPEPEPTGGAHTCGGYFDLECVHTGHWSSGFPALHGDVYCLAFLDTPGDVGSPHNFHLGDECLHGI